MSLQSGMIKQEQEFCLELNLIVIFNTQLREVKTAWNFASHGN